jgi:hypothetical protein
MRRDADDAEPDEDVTGFELPSRQRGSSMSRVANELMRAGLRAARERRPLTPYVPPTFDTGEPLVDVTDVAAALEVLNAGR